MKNLFISLSIMFLFCIHISAQNTMSLKDIQTPASPGFVLADQSPASVEKPNNPRTFGVSLYNLQKGGAFEATPFWFFQHPNYTQKKFVNPIPVFSTFNISSATFKSDTSSVITAGFKTTALRLFSKNTKNNLDSLERAGADLSAIGVTDSSDLQLLDDAKFNWVGGPRFKTLDSAQREKILLKAIDSLKKKINDVRAKPVFQVEFAGAYLGESKSNSFKNLAASKAGGWLNFHWKPEKFPLDILFLSRYSWAIGTNPKNKNDSSFLDFGVGLSYEKNKFDLHLEYVNRQDFSLKQNYDRIVFVANYQVFDEVTLVASLGKNFTNVNNIFTVFGTKIGISKGRVKF